MVLPNPPKSTLLLVVGKESPIKQEFNAVQIYKDKPEEKPAQ